MPLTMSPLAGSRPADELYDIPAFGSARVLHTCDTHAQLQPVYFREASINLGFGEAANKPPHLVGQAALDYYGVPAGTRLAHALTHIDFNELAMRYGAMGGMAHIATLCRRLRADAGDALHLDSGDLWQGSYTALQSGGMDMVQAANQLGIDAMVGHWEFTYPEETIWRNIKAMKGDFLGQNVFVKEEALFDDDVQMYDEDSGRVFKPYAVKTVNGRRIAVVGQAFPFTPISNPQRFIPKWTFGVRQPELQALVDKIHAEEKPNAVVLLSHNGTPLDLAMAANVRGIDFILGGHTHDALPQAAAAGGTVVLNSGSNGKFVGCLDMDFSADGRLRDYRWRLLPVFADLLPPDGAMQSLIAEARAPHEAHLQEKVADTETLLYRRGNFNGSFDQAIVDALRDYYGSDIALSPGFRWGTSVLAGGHIRREDIYNVTAMGYPETYVRQMRGSDIKAMLEGIADNLFNPNPYYQHGGDMVRSGGLRYTLDAAGQSGARISDLRLQRSDAPLEADKMYSVSGWATQQLSEGAPVWEILAAYLGGRKTLAMDRPFVPRFANLNGNAGIAKEWL